MRKIAKRILITSMCSCLLLLSGCSSEDDQKTDTEKTTEETKAINEGDYSAVLPFSPSDANQKHSQMNTNLNDTLAIGSGLMERSKEYFSSKTYAFRGGVYLDYDTLTGLLGRTSEKTPNAMNPEVGTSFDTDTGSVKIKSSDVVLIDIFEYDWYRSSELGGMSLAIVLNDQIGDEINPSTIKEKQLKLYGEECARKLVNYLRKSKPEIGDDLPIYVTLFNLNSSDSNLPGSFFEEAYFESKTNAEFKSIKETWALFPTSKATSLDGTNATYFDRYKASFKEFLNQDVDMIGKGHFVDDELTELKINVTLRAKSADEIMAGVQLLNDRLSIFSSNNFKITVIVKCDDIDVATITRKKGSSSTVAQTLL